MWESVFESTLRQYYKLSTSLAVHHTLDSVTTLWESHLDQVAATLQSPPPSTYLDILQQQRLSALHRNLLVHNHHQLLARQPQASGSRLARLATRHEDVLAKLAHRDQVLATRQAEWDNYTEDQASLAAWLREMEREKQRLNLKHVAVKRINKVRHKITIIYS